MTQTQLASMKIGKPYLPESESRKKQLKRILITDGQTDEILDYITFDNLIRDNHKKSLEDTLETFNFTTFANKRFSEHLEKRNRIIIPDEDNNLVEFVPFEIVKYRDSEGHKIQVYSHASYLEIKKANVIYPDIYEGTATQHLGRALNNTGWRAGIVESGGSRTIRFDKHTNPFAYIKRIARELELEPNFRIEHDGAKITGRYVDLLERVGSWRNRTVEFGKDLQGIRRVEKQDIYTALLGLGPEDVDENRIEVLVEDDDALQRWGRLDEHGELQHLIGTHEIQSTRSDMTEEEAIQYTRTELDKRINTAVTYEANIVDLEHVPGMQNKKIRHGDTIRIKDTKFNPPLYLEARVFESDGSIKERGNKRIKLGDFVEFTQEEVDNIWQSLREEIRNKISQSELIEYTYSKVEIDDKDTYVFDEGKTFAEAVGIDAKDHADVVASDAETSAKSHAEAQDEIVRSDAQGYADTAENNAKDHADQVAEDKSAEALQEALAQSVAREVYDTKMAEIDNELGDKAGIGYVDGQLQVIDGAIDDLNAEIDTKADGSTVYTISEVDGMINNTVSLTQYTTDMDGIVTDLSDQSTQIGQNTEAIGLKADQTDLDDLTGTVDSHSAQFLTMADEISAKVDATYVDTAVGDVDARVSDLSGVVSTQAGLIEAKADSQVVNAQGERITRAESRIDGIEGEITNFVSQSVFDGLETRMSEAEQLITPEAITSTVRESTEYINDLGEKVESDEVVSIIHQESDNITLSANQINFDGHVFGRNATFDGHLDGATGTFSGTVASQKLVVESPSIHNLEDYNDFGLVLQTAQWYPDVNEPFQPAGHIHFNTLNDGLEIYKVNLSGNNRPLEYFQVSTKSVMFTSLDLMAIDGDLFLDNAQTGGGHNNALNFGTGDSRHSIGDWNDSFTFYGNRANGYPLLVRSHNNGSSFRSDLYVGSNGNLYSTPTYETTSSNSPNLRIGLNNGESRFLRATSARKYKTHIEPANVDVYRILDLEPASWIDLREYEENGHSTEGLRRYYGIIADQMEEIGLPEYVEYGDDGVENIVERAWTLTLPILKDHEVKITDNINRLDDYKEKINRIELENQLLKNELKIIKELIA